MGIPSYFSYIIKNHSDIVKQFNSNIISVSNFYLDCNSIIYDSYNKIDPQTLNENSGIQIIQSVISKIEEYINIIRPTNKIIIAFDGIAPIAKLKQQRERRYKSWYQSNVIKDIEENKGLHIQTNSWDRAAITPGTIFMNELNERINNHFKSNKLVIVSGSDQVGEGEHKIFQYIRNNPSNENTFIYGLDSDLIMLSINHLHICKNIYLFRETPNFVQFINPNLEPNKNYFLDIPELYNSIKNFMSNEITSNEINRVHDYILICFLLGNDFLPHFPALNIRTGGIDKILNAYKQVLGNTNNILTNGNIIYWDNFKQIIQYLANHENTYIINEHKLRNKMEYKTNFIDDDIQYFNSTPLFRRELEEYINPFKPKWQHRYYKALLTNNSNLIYDKKSISINYLEGIEWTLKYYTTGQIDWNWKYNYNYPPLLQDLVKYIPESNSHQFITEYNKNSINELTQLCYVLPVNSLHLIPTNLSNLLLNKHPEWYRFDCDFVWAYTRYFWEAHVEMNDINIEELSEIISSFNSSLNVENDTSTSLDK